MDTDLPDSLLWFIFSKLTLKDHVKTSTLSKHWLQEWKSSSTHLNFDLYNTFHYKTLPKDLPHFRALQSQFTAKLDQFMLNYQHATISSIRVNFPLGNKHCDVIDRLITQGIAKGVKHLELLFSHETNHIYFSLEIEQYRFSLNLLSNADSLTYLHLKNCLLVAPMEFAPMDFSGLKNLTTLVLQIIVWKRDQDLFESLFSNCIHLVDFTLNNCEFHYRMRIISPTLFHLKIVNCHFLFTSVMDIIAPNLSSFEYSCPDIHSINLEAHMLSRLVYRSNIVGFVNRSSLKNVTTIVLDGFQFLHICIMPYLFQECLQLEDVTLRNCPMKDEIEITSTKLRHLKIIDCCYGRTTPYEIFVDAKNLSSFEYSGHATRKFSVTAPMLSKVFWNAAVREKNRNFFPIPKLKEKNLKSLGPIPKLHQIENLAIIMGDSQISKLKVLDRFQNLRQLELFIDEGYYPFRKNFSILDVLAVSQHLQKISLTVRISSWDGYIQRKSEKFFHNELKYVELHGCVCTPLAIELAKKLLRNVNSLKRITFSSLYKFYVGAGRWTKGWDSNWFDRSFIYESLKSEVKGECELIIL